MTTARAALAACVSLLLTPPVTAAAQTPAAATRVELRLTSGAFVPTASQRHALADAHLTAAQLSWTIRPSLAITGSFAWARSRDLGTADSPKLDVFSSDAGVEARPALRLARGSTSFAPFVGAGAGVRSYNHRSLDVDATNTLAGYAAAGGDVGLGRVSVRLEMRDYVAGFRPLTGAGRATLRNDVAVMAALRFHRKQGADR